jgi:tetratricopeptide (TPR) repeat protein
MMERRRATSRISSRHLALACGLALVVPVAEGCGGASPQAEAASDARASDPLNAVPAAELYRRGMILGQHGDFVRAEQYLLAARYRGFDEARVIPALMEVCVRASRLSAALGYAEPYLESHPTNWPLRILVGSIHLGLGHLAQARTHLERALRDGQETAARDGHPEPAEAHYLLGIVMREQAELVEARVHFARYAELEPQGTHAEEVGAILAEPEPHQASPIPPTVRPASVPTRLPNTASGTAPTDAAPPGAAQAWSSGGEP